MKTVIDFLQAGGGFMYIILGLSLVAVAIIIERYMVLTLSYPLKKRFFGRVLKYLKRGEYSTAQELCLGTTHPLAQEMISIMENRKNSKDAIESAANLSMQKIIPKIQKRTTYLQMIGNIATLVGLLGTIFGLIQSFMSLQGASAAAKAELLAEGISTAMNTTAFGLIVAIPCIMFFTLISNKESKILQKYEEVLDEVVHVMSFQTKN